MHYRSEIDGLRAVAVLPVILFHAGFSVFSGGYIGVDVFFVISGYLITGILISELESGTFSVAGFYERRARRILPALFVVMTACLPFAFMWMVPEQLEEFGKSLGTVVLFASNIFFWSEDNYFATAAELKPLLHTWSLAVEEQYYIFFPLFLVLVWRFGQKIVFASIIVLAGASLLLAQFDLRDAPSASFYLAPHRAWELLVGSICAILARSKGPKPNGLLGAIGMGLIVLAVFAYDKYTPFPGLSAVLPVLGTALIILFATSRKGIGRLLSTPALVGIGLISYSAYLWHQPLFAFARLRSFPEPSPALMAFLAAVSLLLAWGTWRFVEQPFRKRSKPLLVRRRDVFAAAGSVGGALFVVALAFDLGEGLEWRLDDRALKLYASASASTRREKCHFEPDSTFGPDDSCVYFGTAPTVAVYGNSHGVELALGLARKLNETERSLIHFTVSGCGPGFRREVPAYCADFYESRLEYLLERSGITSVVLAFRAEGGDGSAAASFVDLANALSSAGKQVVVVLQAPILPADISIYLRRAFNTGLSTLPAMAREDWVAVNAHMYAQAERLADGVAVVDMADVFCNAEVCHAISDDVALYFDDDHMSVHGALLAAPRIIEHLN